MPKFIKTFCIFITFYDMVFMLRYSHFTIKICIEFLSDMVLSPLFCFATFLFTCRSCSCWLHFCTSLKAWKYWKHWKYWKSSPDWMVWLPMVGMYLCGPLSLYQWTWLDLAVLSFYILALSILPSFQKFWTNLLH